MSGYIKIDRKIFDNPMWSEKPFTKGQAWIDLIGLANWKDSEIMNGYEVITIHRGEVARSQKWLAERWGWDRKKVRRFLKGLSDDQALSINASPNGTTLTIENYNKYQGEGATNDPAIPHQLPINSPHKNNNKNNKKNNFIKRDIRERDNMLAEAHDSFKAIKRSLMQA